MVKFLTSNGQGVKNVYQGKELGFISIPNAAENILAHKGTHHGYLDTSSLNNGYSRSIVKREEGHRYVVVVTSTDDWTTAYVAGSEPKFYFLKMNDTTYVGINAHMNSSKMRIINFSGGILYYDRVDFFNYSTIPTIATSDNIKKVYHGSQLLWDYIVNYTTLTPEMVSGTIGTSDQRYIGTATDLIIDDSFPTDSLNSLFKDNQTLKSLVIRTNKFTNMSNIFDSIGSQFEYLSINTSNVVNMSNMISWAKTTKIDVSSFDTSNMTDMNSMFYRSPATILGLSSFNTFKVTDMTNMFNSSKATSIDLSSFNTSNVTSMHGMFQYFQATTLDLSSFDTFKVTDMTNMFNSSQATKIDLSSFDTSNVTSMMGMFAWSKATILDVSSFDTSNVTDMGSMFNRSQATSLDLSSFNTSKVTHMNSMFYDSQTTTLDLSSFDTSNVTDMTSMFSNSQATSLDLSSFDTSKVTRMGYMFYGSQATTLDLSSFDASNVTDMTDMFSESQATFGYARTQADADRFNASSNKPEGLTFVVK